MNPDDRIRLEGLRASSERPDRWLTVEQAARVLDPSYRRALSVGHVFYAVEVRGTRWARHAGIELAADSTRDQAWEFLEVLGFVRGAADLVANMLPVRRPAGYLEERRCWYADEEVLALVPAEA